MQKKYLITYNLKTTNWNYTGFFSTLQNIGSWWHYLDTTWIIKSEFTSQQIYSMIAPHLSKSDLILVVEIVANTSFGWLPKDAWDWLNN